MAVLVRADAPNVSVKIDADDFARFRHTPDWQTDTCLHNHMVAKHARQLYASHYDRTWKKTVYCGRSSVKTSPRQIVLIRFIRSL